MKNFADLTEREVLAVAISSEEEDSRIYMELRGRSRRALSGIRKGFRGDGRGGARPSPSAAGNVRTAFRPASAADPPGRRQGISCAAAPIWLTKNLALDTIRKEVETMELEAERFYVKAAEKAEDVGVRRLLGDLAEEEKGHEQLAVETDRRNPQPDVRAEEDRTRRRVFVLQYVQPGLAGLMDGRCRRWRRCSPRPLPRIRTGRHFLSASPPRSAPASAWALPKPCPTTDR